MKNRWLKMGILGAAVCCTVAALTLMSGEVPVKTALVEPAGSVLIAEARITCTFHCNDGTGYVLLDCEEGSLGACCAVGATACDDNGGLESSICRQGRLGLPCQPFDP